MRRLAIEVCVSPSATWTQSLPSWEDGKNSVENGQDICDLSDYPFGCEKKTDGVECIRVDKYIQVDWVCVGVLLLATMTSISGTTAVYIYVRNQGRATRRRNFDGRRSSAKDIDHLNEVARQTILFLIAFLNGTFWSFLTRIVFDTLNVDGGEHQPGLYSMALLACIFFPLQGFWNCFIYIRPRYLLWRKAKPDVSRVWILQKVFSADEPGTRLRPRLSLLRGPRSRDMSIEPEDGVPQWDVSDIGAKVRSALVSIRNRITGSDRTWSRHQSKDSPGEVLDDGSILIEELGNQQGMTGEVRLCRLSMIDSSRMVSCRAEPVDQAVISRHAEQCHISPLSEVPAISSSEADSCPEYLTGQEAPFPVIDGRPSAGEEGVFFSGNESDSELRGSSDDVSSVFKN